MNCHHDVTKEKENKSLQREVVCFTVPAGTTEKHRKLWGIQDLHPRKWVESYVCCKSHSEVFSFMDLVVFGKNPPPFFFSPSWETKSSLVCRAGKRYGSCEQGGTKEQSLTFRRDAGVREGIWGRTQKKK